MAFIIIIKILMIIILHNCFVFFRNIILLNKANLAPRLYATFENGLAYEFVPGNTLTEETVINPKIYKLVAARMALLHNVKVVSDAKPEPVLWKKLHNYLDLIPEQFSDLKKHKR